jgi:hypothetical protein
VRVDQPGKHKPAIRNGHRTRYGRHQDAIADQPQIASGVVGQDNPADV